MFGSLVIYDTKYRFLEGLFKNLRNCFKIDNLFLNKIDKYSKHSNHKNWVYIIHNFQHIQCHHILNYKCH